MQSLFVLLLAVVAAARGGPTRCGVQRTPARYLTVDRILRGRDADGGSWPWHVTLLTTKELVPSCGATLISSEWAITAAHCIMSLRGVQSYLALMGVTKLYEPSGRPQLHAIREVVVHPDFERVHVRKTLRAPRNDVALLRLNTPAAFTDAVRPICLPPADGSFSTNVECFIAGFGVTDLKEKMPSPLLQEALVSVLNDSECPIVPGDKYMFCAGGDGPDSCQGDSGGGLFCQADDDRFYLMGVVSWGARCGTAPGYYTRLHRYAHWIHSVLSDPRTPAIRIIVQGHSARPVAGSTTVPPAGPNSTQPAVDLTTVPSTGPDSTQAAVDLTTALPAGPDSSQAAVDLTDAPSTGLDYTQAAVDLTTAPPAGPDSTQAAVVVASVPPTGPQSSQTGASTTIVSASVTFMSPPGPGSSQEPTQGDQSSQPPTVSSLPLSMPTTDSEPNSGMTTSRQDEA